MSRPLRLLVCGGRRREGIIVSGLSLEVGGGTLTAVESSEEETSLGEMPGAVPGSAQHAFVLELRIDGGGVGNKHVAVTAWTPDSLPEFQSQLCH